MRKYLAATLVAALPCFAAAADHPVHQRANQFDVKTLRVKPGDTVTFVNDDPHHHNIFSLSESQSFDVGSFGTHESRKVTFAKEGRVEVECAIHPGMRMVVDVAR